MNSKLYSFQIQYYYYWNLRIVDIAPGDIYRSSYITKGSVTAERFMWIHFFIENLLIIKYIVKV